MTRSPSRASRLAAAGAAAALALPLALSACAVGSTPEPATTAGASATTGELKPVKLQLQWVTQAQFAGYFAAVEQGFYRDAGLDVEILEGGVDIVPQTVLAQGQADYAIAWVPKALASREQGAGITNVAQVFRRSGTLQVSFKDKGITRAADLQGKKVGNWGFGNEFELFAGMTKAGITPGTDNELVQQQFDMLALLKGDIDAAQAMTYNEYAQVLEAENPATGQLYQPSDFTVIDWNDEGTAMLQDSVWANTERLSDPEYELQTVAFLAASMQGWAYCRDEPESCRDIVVAEGSKLGNSHQLWQMNEVNKLIWPSPTGVGLVEEAAWTQTVDIALQAKNAEGKTVLTEQPQGEAYTTEYAQAALELLKEDGVDVVGEGFQPLTVKLEPGGA